MENRASGNGDDAEEQESKAGGSRANWADLLDWKVDRHSDVPFYQQVAEFLRHSIASGTIPRGSRLPSSRQLLDKLGVSRTTVIAAYSQLLADGYIVGQVGSGTYVAHDIINQVDSNTLPPLNSSTRNEWPLSSRGQRYQKIPLNRILMENVPFNTGMVRVDGRTSTQWRQIANRNLTIDPTYLAYNDPAGDFEVRDEIANYLRVARGMRCSPDQVMPVAGTQQGIDLAIKVLLDPGDQVWVEDPAYPLTTYAMDAAGMSIRAIRVDDEGMCVSEGIAAAPDARAVFVTPSHQYPLGVTLSMERRATLLEWAMRNNAWVVEDDYDSEFRYEDRPLPALQALDVAERVIYIGSFSKVLFPGLRYGYMVVPRGLVGVFNSARFLTDRFQPVFFGNVLAEFMARSFFVSHINRMRSVYRRVRNILVEQLTQNLGDLIEVSPPSQGMHLVMYLRSSLSDEVVSEVARKEGVVTRPISRLYRSTPPASGLMLGFTGFDEHRIRSAAARLCAVVKRVHTSGGSDC